MRHKLETNSNLETRIILFYERLLRHIEDLKIFEVEDFKDTKYWAEYYKIIFDIKEEQ